MSINRVVLTGNLTRDPELRQAGSTEVCQLGVAVNGREKRDGEWVEVPNFFDVTVWGAQGNNCAKFLSKGSPVAVDGRLRWRSWEKDGQKRSAIDVVADSVQFLSQGRPLTDAEQKSGVVDDQEEIPF
jgi:single-strand DNA-binding protein